MLIFKIIYWPEESNISMLLLITPSSLSSELISPYISVEQKPSQRLFCFLKQPVLRHISHFTKGRQPIINHARQAYNNDKTSHTRWWSPHTCQCCEVPSSRNFKKKIEEKTMQLYNIPLGLYYNLGWMILSNVIHINNHAQIKT